MSLENCGYDGSCSGWVVRYYGQHIATFRRAVDADEYVRVFSAELSSECDICNVGNPGVYVKDGHMVCPHRSAPSAQQEEGK